MTILIEFFKTTRLSVKTHHSEIQYARPLDVSRQGESSAWFWGIAQVNWAMLAHPETAG